MAEKTAKPETGKKYRRKIENPELRGEFLDHILAGDSITAAAHASGLDTQSIKWERSKDPHFARQVQDALDIRGDITGPAKKMTDAVKAAIIADMRKRACRPTVAARSAGVSEGTLNKERHSDPDFDFELLEAERFSVDRVEDTLYKTALKGNVRACETILYNRAPDRWAAPRTLERRASEVERKAHEELTTSGEGGKDLTLAEQQALVKDLLREVANRTPEQAV